MARRQALVTLGVPVDAPSEHYQAQMWSLWTGESIDCDMSRMPRQQRLAVLDEICENSQRRDAPAVIDLWSSDHPARRGLASAVWQTVRDRSPADLATG